MDLKTIRVIVDKLSILYGMPINDPNFDPLGGLVETILSQSTSDINSSRAYADLCNAFPSWEAVRDATPESIASVIHHGGLANIKSRRIIAALQTITLMLPPSEGSLAERFSKWLSALPVSEARESLQCIPSVGPKTAACVLLFSLDAPSMPVDTHVYRVSQRIGLIGEHDSVATAHKRYDAVLPPELVYPVHVLLITHGRQICRARNPQCRICPLIDMCKYGQSQVKTRYPTDFST
jgi:endonuclease-3